MAKIASNGVKPDAWIVINNQKDKSKPSDRGRKSIKNGKVYLENGDEFEVELYNPLTVSVLCEIKLNGNSISKTGLVLKPGQRFYLDCFIDDKKKFIFNTYEIENCQESKDATKSNGLLEVFFYKEEVLLVKEWKKKFDKVIIEKWYPVYYPHYIPSWHTYPSQSPYFYSTTNHNITFDRYKDQGTNIFGPRNNDYGRSTNPIIGMNVGYSENITNYGSNTSNYVTNTIFNSTGEITTGRVEKGEESSQKFEDIDMDFESNFISSTIIQILPESVKPVEVKEIVVKKPQLKDILKRESDEVIELIKKLGDLHSAGILTDDEFTSKKKELLSKI